MLLVVALGWMVPAGPTMLAAADDTGVITGIVTSTNDPEAGVWVIAETDDLETMFRKIVVTNDEGRFLIPELPDVTYRVWLRGYGLVDSTPTAGTPGQNLALRATVAPTPQAAAQVYPGNYWLSLIDLPDASEFPGTGPEGNGMIRHEWGWPDHQAMERAPAAGGDDRARVRPGARHACRRLQLRRHPVPGRCLGVGRVGRFSRAPAPSGSR